MRVCFVCDQVFGWGKYGGYGTILKLLTKHLKKRGIECLILTWRNPDQREVEIVDDVAIYSYSYDPMDSSVAHLVSYLSSVQLFKKVDADVFHHIDARVETYLARKLKPDCGHVIHFQDPYDENDFRLMSSVDSTYHFSSAVKIKLWLTYSLLHTVCKPPAMLYAPAKYLVPKIKRLFKLNYAVGFLPNLVDIPASQMRKASEPTVCFLGRLDPQKRIHLFLELAEKFPNIKFLAMGMGRNPKADETLKRRYAGLRNLEIMGLVTDEMKFEVLGKSWVLINTSIREAMPLSFLEALAHKTSILSCVDPDGLVSKFGVYVEDLDFVGGLKKLLANDLWNEKGREGYRYVERIHDASKIIYNYLDVYRTAAKMNRRKQ